MHHMYLIAPFISIVQAKDEQKVYRRSIDIHVISPQKIF